MRLKRDTGYVGDKIDGLEADLDSAIDLMVRVACGEQTVQAMGEWLSLNHPKHRWRLPEQMRALPPKPKG